MKDDDYDDDEANKFGGEDAAAAFGGGGLFGDIFYKDDEEEIIEKVPDTSDDLLNDLLHEIGQDFGGLGRLLPHGVLRYLRYCYPSDFGDFHFNTSSSSGIDSSDNGSSILNIDDIYDTFSSEWDQGLEVNPVVFYSMV